MISGTFLNYGVLGCLGLEEISSIASGLKDIPVYILAELSEQLGLGTQAELHGISSEARSSPADLSV